MKMLIEPRNNIPLATASILFSILFAPIGIILSITTLVRIAKNRLDETIADTDFKAQMLSVIALVISLAITIALSVMTTNNTAPWQIYEQQQAPVKITEEVESNLNSVINMNEANKQQISQTLGQTYTTNNINVEELGVSGEDMLNWILEGSSYTIDGEPTIDGDSASISVTIHHHDVSYFTNTYISELTQKLENNEFPSIPEMGKMMKNIMANTEYIDNTLDINLVKENYQWVITDESSNEVAHILFDTGANE